MIVVIKRGTTPDELSKLTSWLKEQGVDVRVSVGEFETVLGVIGDTGKLDKGLVARFPAVESVKTVSEPYKLCSRKLHPADTVVEAGKVKLGGGSFGMIAGPCSVESEEQLVAIAKAVKAAGADMLRGGAFKPRTSPYDFQGLRERGMELLKMAKQETGLPVVSELVSINDLPLFEDVDVLQIGARNMQNYELLKEIGRLRKPVLLKRGLSATLRELLLSAEYIMAGGNDKIILCERGIRTFEDSTRNTLDLSAVPVLHELSHLPVIVDPSHATGRAGLVRPMALAAAACGADGLMIEVHNEPLQARCDGAQAMLPEAYAELCRDVQRVREVSVK